MDRHVTALGVIYIASGILGILIGLFLFWVLVIPGVASGETKAIAVLGTLGGMLGGVIAVLSIPEIIAGYGLLKHKEWARILGLILGVLSLLEIPIGTAIGIYALWVLLKDETQRLFRPASPMAGA